MKVYLINLDKDKDRLAAADAQLKRLGVAYERVSAVYAKELPQKELDGAVNKFRWWCAVGRHVRVGEIGCAMSHYSIYRQMTEPVCILEDDVILDDRFPEVLTYVETHINLSCPQVVLLSNHLHVKIDTRSTRCAIAPATAGWCTEGYVITPLAAQALLKANWPMQTPCDHWGRWVRHGVIQLFHAVPTVCRQDRVRYESGITSSDGFRVGDLNWTRFIAHKLKRVVGRLVDVVFPL